MGEKAAPHFVRRGEPLASLADIHYRRESEQLRWRALSSGPRAFIDRFRLRSRRQLPSGSRAFSE
jgi:hypothetical protein